MPACIGSVPCAVSAEKEPMVSRETVCGEVEQIARSFDDEALSRVAGARECFAQLAAYARDHMLPAGQEYSQADVQMLLDVFRTFLGTIHDVYADVQAYEEQSLFLFAGRLAVDEFASLLQKHIVNADAARSICHVFHRRINNAYKVPRSREPDSAGTARTQCEHIRSVVAQCFEGHRWPFYLAECAELAADHAQEEMDVWARVANGDAWPAADRLRAALAHAERLLLRAQEASPAAERNGGIEHRIARVRSYLRETNGRLLRLVGEAV